MQCFKQSHQKVLCYQKMIPLIFPFFKRYFSYSDFKALQGTEMILGSVLGLEFAPTNSFISFGTFRKVTCPMIEYFLSSVNLYRCLNSFLPLTINGKQI